MLLSAACRRRPWPRASGGEAGSGWSRRRTPLRSCPSTWRARAPPTKCPGRSMAGCSAAWKAPSRARRWTSGRSAWGSAELGAPLRSSSSSAPSPPRQRPRRRSRRPASSKSGSPPARSGCRTSATRTTR